MTSKINVSEAWGAGRLTDQRLVASRRRTGKSGAASTASIRDSPVTLTLLNTINELCCSPRLERLLTLTVTFLRYKAKLLTAAIALVAF